LKATLKQANQEPMVPPIDVMSRQKGLGSKIGWLGK